MQIFALTLATGSIAFAQSGHYVKEAKISKTGRYIVAKITYPGCKAYDYAVEVKCDEKEKASKPIIQLNPKLANSKEDNGFDCKRMNFAKKLIRLTDEQYSAVRKCGGPKPKVHVAAGPYDSGVEAKAFSRRRLASSEGEPRLRRMLPTHDGVEYGNQ